MFQEWIDLSNRKPTGTLAVLLGVLGLCASTALHADHGQLGEPISTAVSGWGVPMNVDVNEDGLTAGSTTTHGFGRVGFGSLGPWQAHTVSELSEVVDVCGPTAVVLEYRIVSIIQRLARGDLVYYELDPEYTSSICFDYESGEVVSNEVYLLVAGGTGEYAGASGHAKLEATGRQLLADALGNTVHSSLTGKLRGRLYR